MAISETIFYNKHRKKNRGRTDQPASSRKLPLAEVGR